jgi:hypothetical protein
VRARINVASPSQPGSELDPCPSTGDAHCMTRHSPRHELDNWLDSHGYRHVGARKQKTSHPYAMGHSTRKSSATSGEAKWTSGAHPALFVDSTAGTWKAMVNTDESTWSVRGPDPDNEAHYASGEVSNADVNEASALDLKGRIAAAKKQARAYIMGQIGASGTKKTSAIREAELAAALAQRDAGLAADAAVRFVRPGDRFRYIGDVYQVISVEHKPRVGQTARGTVSMGREVTDLFGKTVLIDLRSWPRAMLREMTKI